MTTTERHTLLPDSLDKTYHLPDVKDISVWGVIKFNARVLWISDEKLIAWIRADRESVERYSRETRIYLNKERRKCKQV